MESKLTNTNDAQYFVTGERWWSRDGVTWHRGEPSKQQRKHATALDDSISTATVIVVDKVRGILVTS